MANDLTLADNGEMSWGNDDRRGQKDASKGCGIGAETPASAPPSVRREGQSGLRVIVNGS